MAVEILEAEVEKLRRRLEELERIKERLKELEEEEKEILKKVPDGTVVEKWVKRGEKLCGPYYYVAKKVNGKTKWKYLGKVKPSQTELKERLREIRKEKKKLLRALNQMRS